MLGMNLSFLILTFVGAVVASAYHYVIRYRFLESDDALVGTLIVGWLGGWLGSPVLGHWLWRVENVYIVPCHLGRDRDCPLDCFDGEGTRQGRTHAAGCYGRKEGRDPSCEASRSGLRSRCEHQALTVWTRRPWYLAVQLRPYEASGATWRARGTPCYFEKKTKTLKCFRSRTEPRPGAYLRAN
jgi:hypothetical protein